MPLRRALESSIPEARARLVPAGVELYRQGECCDSYFAVLNGWVALSVCLENGSSQILDFLTTGAFLGLRAGSKPEAEGMYHSARCLTEVLVRAYPRETLDQRITATPGLAYLLCRQLSGDEARAHDRLVSLGVRSAKERVAHLLLDLCRRLRPGLPLIRGDVVQLPLSQIRMGEAVGLTNVHVSRTLRVLREENVVDLSNGKLTILDPVALMKAAGEDWRHGPASPSREMRQERSKPPFAARPVQCLQA